MSRDNLSFFIKEHHDSNFFIFAFEVACLKNFFHVHYFPSLFQGKNKFQLHTN